jgi:penicillin-binding protein 1C
LPAATTALPLSIQFPVDGSTVSIRQRAGMPLIASGGQPPLRWLVNDTPLPVDVGGGSHRPRRQTLWHPHGVGFARVTVVDAGGRAASARVRVQR